MSGIKDFKITDTTGYKVSDTPGDTLSGTVAENKQVFDNLGELIISQYNEALDYLDEQGVDTGTSTLISEVYPVGSIYMSINATNPTTLFGGTWVRIQDKFLLCAGSAYAAGATGGSADAALPSHTHTLTASMESAGAHTHFFSGSTGPSGTHSHKISEHGYPGPSGAVTVGSTAYANCGGNAHSPSTEAGGNHNHSFSGTTQSDGAHTHTITATASTVGESATGKNMPPYLAVYVWYRTA